MTGEVNANPFENPTPDPAPVKRGPGRPPKTPSQPQEPPEESPAIPATKQPMQRSDPKNERIIGRDTSYYSDEELEYLKERLKEFDETLGHDRRSTALVNEVLQCDIEMQRLDAKAAGLTSRENLTIEMVKQLKAISGLRDDYKASYIEGLDLLGALPKDRKKNPNEDSLFAVHRRYKAEIEELKKRHQQVGHPSKEAVKLARAAGRDPEEFKIPGALEEETRDVILAKSDAAEPREEA